MTGEAFGLRTAISYIRSAQCCPDCDADAEVIDRGGYVELLIRHDATCPLWRTRRPESGPPYRVRGVLGVLGGEAS